MHWRSRIWAVKRKGWLGWLKAHCCILTWRCESGLGGGGLCWGWEYSDRDLSVCLCAAATPQELSVTGGLTGPHQSKGIPAPSMEAGNPEWGWGCSSQSFFIVWDAWSSTALPTQVGCSDAFLAPSSHSPECSISAFASFLPTTFRHHLSNHNQPTPPCWEVSASPANPGKAAGWVTARHAVGFWQGEALTLRCVWLLQAQVGLWWWKSKTTAVKVCHEQNAATCKGRQKMKSWCGTRESCHEMQVN